MIDLLIIGEILTEIMRVREDIPLNVTGTFSGPYPSGAPAICASAAARLGCSTTLIGRVGNDDFGNFILSRLKKDSVDCRFIGQDSRLSTGCAFVTYSHDGSRKFIFHMGAAAEAELPPLSALGPVGHLHIMGCSVTAGRKLSDGIMEAMGCLSQKGTVISFDPNIRRELLESGEGIKQFEEIMNHTRIFLPGKEELLLVTGETTAEKAVEKCFALPGMEIIVLKDGSRGCRLYTKSKTVSIPPCTVEQKDATGAGDCFDGAFLAGLIRGLSPEDAARTAAAAGALNAAAFGPMEGDISPETIRQLLEQTSTHPA